MPERYFVFPAVPRHAALSGRRHTRWYTVRHGDTVWSISRKFRISRSGLLRLNNLTTAKIRPGQRLRVSGSVWRSFVRKRVSGKRYRRRKRSGTRWYRVRRGDSYWRIARKFGIRVSSLKRLNRGRRLLRGKRIRVPGKGGKRFVRTKRHSRRRKRRYRKRRRYRGRRYARRGRYFGSIPRSFRIRLRWPVRGRVVERFGLGRKWISNGITIRTRAGRSIRAAGSGVIAFRGRKRGYGLMVIVRHANNIYSVYTNMQGSGVRRGQRVLRGTVLGRTGKVKGLKCYGLHFELYYKTRPVNPVKYLS